MKLLVLLAGAITVVVSLPLLIFGVVATNPWLAVAGLAHKARGSAPIVVTSVPGVDGMSLAGQLVPADQWAVMQQTADASSCGVRSSDLASIAKVESEFGSNMTTNSTGHFGYGQFDAPTWATYGRGNPYDFHDALPAIVRTLCARGYARDRVRALNSYGGCVTANCLGNVDYAGAVGVTTDRITSLSLVASGDVVAVARAFLGVPYFWGGTTSAGLDCSGLVVVTYAKLGITTMNGRPFQRVAADQYTATQRITQAQPGDLVFFANTDGPGITHVGIVVDPVAGTMIDAPTTGTVVRIESYVSGFFGSHLSGFGRVIP